MNSTQISSIMYIRRGICLSCLQNSKNVAKTCHFEALHYYLSESVHLKNVSKIDVDNLFLSLSQTRPRGCFNVNHPLLPLTFRNSFNMIWNFSVVSFMRLSAENLPTSSFIANVWGWNMIVPLLFCYHSLLQVRNKQTLPKKPKPNPQQQQQKYTYKICLLNYRKPKCIG